MKKHLLQVALFVIAILPVAASAQNLSGRHLYLNGEGGMIQLLTSGQGWDLTQLVMQGPLDSTRQLGYNWSLVGTNGQGGNYPEALTLWEWHPNHTGSAVRHVSFTEDRKGDGSYQSIADFGGGIRVNGGMRFTAAGGFRQMLNLYSSEFGVGVQSGSLYQRTSGRFAWYKNGSHVDSPEAGPGGETLMSLDSQGLAINTGSPQAKLHVNGSGILGQFAVGTDAGGYDFPYEWESIGLFNGQNNFRIQSPTSFLVHTGPNFDARMWIDSAGNTIFNGKVSVTTLELTCDPKQKRDIQPVSVSEVLAKVNSLPITTWAYTNSPGVRHMAPMSTDFRAAFNLGEDDKHISAVDGIGVAFAAIKGLHELVQEKDARIGALESRMARLEKQLTASVAAIERLTAAQIPEKPSNLRVSTPLQ